MQKWVAIKQGSNTEIIHFDPDNYMELLTAVLWRLELRLDGYTVNALH